MKYFIFSFLSASVLTGCSMKNYYLDDTKQNRKFLVDKIEEFSEKGIISEKPILVIDGIEFVSLNDINLKRMELSKADIKEIELLKRDAAVRVFGNAGERGVLLITTKN